MSRTLLLTFVTMVAFAANSVLCRLALSHSAIDPASFTFVRLASGAAALWLMTRLSGNHGSGGSWKGAASLALYAVAFSLAYVSLPAGTGALLLFGTVQVTMIAAGFVQGERLALGQWIGLAAAMAGLVVLVAPGVSAPPPLGAALMVLSGVFASGCGYILWYSVLPRLSAAQGASVQLGVPVIAALGGALLMGEALTLRLGIAALATLGGIALVIAQRRR